MHRFIPVYASWAGAKVAEIPVRHHPRLSGSSKYGLSRTFKVILDLITVKMLGSYSTKPMYFFGGVGLMACAAGFIFALWTLYDKFFSGVKAHNNPFLLLAVFLFLLGVQFVLMGLVAELVIRTYFESQGKSSYIVRRVIAADNNKDRTKHRSTAPFRSEEYRMFSEQFAFNPHTLVNFVGGGGKTALIHKLMQEYCAQGPVLYTTTTRIHPPDPREGLAVISSDNRRSSEPNGG